MRLKVKNVTQRASDLIRKEKTRGGRKKPLLAALSYYTSPFFAEVSQGSRQNSRVPPGAWSRHFESSPHEKALSWG